MGDVNEQLRMYGQWLADQAELRHRGGEPGAPADVPLAGQIVAGERRRWWIAVAASLAAVVGVAVAVDQMTMPSVTTDPSIVTDPTETTAPPPSTSTPPSQTTALSAVPSDDPLALSRPLRDFAVALPSEMPDGYSVLAIIDAGSGARGEVIVGGDDVPEVRIIRQNRPLLGEWTDTIMIGDVEWNIGGTSMSAPTVLSRHSDIGWIGIESFADLDTTTQIAGFLEPVAASDTPPEVRLPTRTLGTTPSVSLDSVDLVLDGRTAIMCWMLRTNESQRAGGIDLEATGRCRGSTKTVPVVQLGWLKTPSGRYTAGVAQPDVQSIEFRSADGELISRVDTVDDPARAQRSWLTDAAVIAAAKVVAVRDDGNTQQLVTHPYRRGSWIVAELSDELPDRVANPADAADLTRRDSCPDDEVVSQLLDTWLYAAGNYNGSDTLECFYGSLDGADVTSWLSSGTALVTGPSEEVRVIGDTFVELANRERTAGVVMAANHPTRFLGVEDSTRAFQLSAAVNTPNEIENQRSCQIRLSLPLSADYGGLDQHLADLAIDVVETLCGYRFDRFDIAALQNAQGS